MNFLSKDELFTQVPAFSDRIKAGSFITATHYYKLQTKPITALLSGGSYDYIKLQKPIVHKGVITQVNRETIRYVYYGGDQDKIYSHNHYSQLGHNDNIGTGYITTDSIHNGHVSITVYDSEE